MGEWWSGLTGVEQLFWGISIVFSVLFVIQFILSLIGFDFEGDVDFEVGDAEPGMLDSDFTVLSVRSFIAFFTFFGWAGVLVLKGGGSTIMAFIAGGLSGLAAMFVVGYIMYLFSTLQETGNADLSEAIFNTGEVYLSIPAAKTGAGKIHIKINGSLKELDAVTEGGAIATGAKVRVIEILDDNILQVETIGDFMSLNNEF